MDVGTGQMDVRTGPIRVDTSQMEIGTGPIRVGTSRCDSLRVSAGPRDTLTRGARRDLRRIAKAHRRRERALPLPDPPHARIQS
jgi:hypothetical protein